MISPPQFFTVKVPTKVYLRKWIHARYGYPLKLNYNSTIGVLVLCLLGKENFDIKMKAKKKEIRLSYMNDEIELSSSTNTMSHKGFSLSDDKIIAINRFFEEQFQEELHKYCDENIQERNWRPGISVAINQFAEKYGIALEIDISFEALKKAEYRHRKRLQKNLVTFVPQPGRQATATFQGLVFG